MKIYERVIAAISAICFIFPLGTLDLVGGAGIAFLIIKQRRGRGRWIPKGKVEIVK